MELCSLEDAFPEIAKAGPGKEERKAAKKKAKRCKGPALDYLKAQDGEPVDPDRPAVKRLGEIPPFVPYSDAFPDLSGTISEGFKLPVLPGSNCLVGDQGLPAYFGKGVEDEEEGFQNQVFDGGFEGVGALKAGSNVGLPAPNTSDNWKPLTDASATTAFFSKLPTSMGAKIVKPAEKADLVPDEKIFNLATASAAVETTARDTLLMKIQELTKRLEDLEKQHGPQRNTQKELLMFVGAGLFLLFSFDVAVRATR